MNKLYYKSIKLNTILSFIQKIMNLLIPLITFPYASRLLLPEGIGKVNFAHSITGYFSILAGLGISGYAIRECSKIRDDITKFSKIVKELFIINIISMFCSLLVLLIVLHFFYVLQPYCLLIIICSSSIFFETIGLSWVYTSREDFIFITLTTIFFQFLSLIYLFLFVKSTSDIIEYTIFGVFAANLTNLLCFIHSKHYVNWRLKSKLELKKHIKPIFTLFAMTAAQSVYLILDTTILGLISGDEAVGFYSAAAKINKMALGIITTLSTVLLPRLSYYIETEKEKYYDLLQKSFNIILALEIPITFGLFILSDQLILLICGNNFTNSIVPMKILVPLVLEIPISVFVHQQIFLPNRKDFYSLLTVIIGAITNLFLNLTLIPKWSYYGACISTLIAEFLVMSLSLILSHKLLGEIRNFFRYIYQYLFAAVVMGLLIYMEKNFVHIKSIYLIILEIFTGIVSYCFVLLLYKNKYIYIVINFKKKNK